MLHDRIDELRDVTLRNNNCDFLPQIVGDFIVCIDFNNTRVPCSLFLC